MTAFAYQVRDKDGKRIRGILEAASERALADQLASKGYLVTRIKPQSFSPFASFSIKNALLERSVSSDDLTMFYFQLSHMIESGITLLTSLQTLADQVENNKLNSVIKKLVKSIQNGSSLSEAMERESKYFPILYTSMIRVGETSGHLSDNLKYIAQLNEAKNELSYQVKSALAYPIVLMVASVGIVIFMMLFIVPTFSGIFTRAGVELPLPTRILYETSLMMKSHPLYLVVSVFAVLVGVRILLAIRIVKYFFSRLWLKIPIIGVMTKRIEVSRWSRAVGLMLSSGVPILKTLEIAKALTKNLLFEELYAETVIAVQSGNKLADTLSHGNLFFQDTIQMIATGENSGTLDKMLFKTAEFYDRLITRSLKKLTGVIEPFFVVFMGGIVGFIMISILLPIFEMIKLLGAR